MVRGGFGRSLIEKFPVPKSSHGQEGIFICKGPGIKPHRYEQYITLQDLAPTILYLLGLPIPRDMDGKAHVDIMNSSERKDCRYTEEEASVYESSSISREEEKSLMAKLKALGYMD
jgi:arylsulfatase A-like enzyme